MNALFEVTNAGLGNTVQDLGRFGYRRLGMPVAGATDPILMACANALVGNSLNQSALEIPLSGPHLHLIAGDVQIALAGTIRAKMKHSDGSVKELKTFRSYCMGTGDVLELSATTGTAYLAITGGIDCPVVLKSRSTYTRAWIGGIEGRNLQVGDRFSTSLISKDGIKDRQGLPWQYPADPIRMISGPQDDAFTDEVRNTLIHSTYQVLQGTDRMGMRLSGEKLSHIEPKAADIISDGMIPGAMQVPASGDPIILLADSQTVGGYPKIGVVITADLPRLAHMRPGQSLRFQWVTHEQAMQALKDQYVALQQWVATLQMIHLDGIVDSEQLLALNLVSGFLDAPRFDV
jgi:biotin-dependent carboxylase-like uncharacterized protein